MEQCKAAGIRVGRVPSYSPSSIAEYAVSSIMALAKNIQKSYELTKTADFTIGGLQCMLLEDKVAGIIGTGLIGKKCVQKISGLVSKVLCFDAYPANDWIKTIPNAEYVPLEQLLAEVISLIIIFRMESRVSVQGVKSLVGHFACLCRGFEFYEVNFFLLLFFKKKMEILLHF